MLLLASENCSNKTFHNGWRDTSAKTDNWSAGVTIFDGNHTNSIKKRQFYKNKWS
jgi:hypothetical protein